MQTELFSNESLSDAGLNFDQDVPKAKTFSPEQESVIHSWDQGMAVLAGAGSGKTTTLVEKCIELIRRKPDAKFAAVSFTERSAGDLKNKLSYAFSEQGWLNTFHSHWIMTIHGLCGSILRENPREAGFDGEERILAEADSFLLWERAIEALWVEELPVEVDHALDRLLDRESKDQLSALLLRVRDLRSLGILAFLENTESEYTKYLWKVAVFVLDRYQRLKQRQGSIDFNDLESGADRALNSSKVREFYHRKFDLVLVDEFQDTNPLQASIIWRFAKADQSNLCVVGDPKQSIYRFRDADVSVFEDFCSRLPLNRCLTWNFRSRPGIIQFGNEICSKVFSASDLKFEPLIAKRLPHETLDPVLRLDVQDPESLGTWILDQVKQGIPLHDMALLVRKIRGSEKWLKGLTACGIPIAIGSGGLFWEDPRVRELVAFLRWWENPGNGVSATVFLRAPWMMIPDLVLDQWVKMDPTFQKPFFESNHPVAVSLKPFTHGKGRPGELLLALLVNEEIEDELASSLLGLWHRVDELSSEGLDFHSVVAELTRAVEEKRREREVPAPKNLGQLTILTIHGSKGLEFPHVLLVDFGKKHRSADMPLLFWDRTQGVFLTERDEAGERKRDHPQEAAWREIEKHKELAETKRLFYVALTRAKERLVLICSQDGVPKEDDLGDKVFKEDYWRGWLERSGSSISEVQWNQKLESLPALSSSESNQSKTSLKENLQLTSNPIRFGRARHSVTEWTLLSRCERAYDWTFIRPKIAIESVPEIGALIGNRIPTLVESEISQQELGSRVHSCLERGDYEGLKLLEKEVGADRFNADPVISWALSSSWMAPQNLDQGREVWNELAFEIPFKNCVVVGSIDRLICQKGNQGTEYTVIDFKVSEKAKSADAFLEAYQTQLELYAQAVKVLDPSISFAQIRALLVSITATSVQTIPVKLGVTRLEALADRATEIINGKEGIPSPGNLCRSCEFRFQCPEGKIKVAELEKAYEERGLFRKECPPSRGDHLELSN